MEEAEIVNEYENISLLEKEEDETDLKNSLEFKEKIRRSGLIYMSNIPKGMTVRDLKRLFSDYGVQRVYLVPKNEKHTEDSQKTVRTYKEGWVEFEDKLLAKLAEYQLNGKCIGGKKNCPYKDDIWTIKYLHKYKWHNLMEKMNYNKNIREKKLKTEIAQSKRENEFILKNIARSKLLNKKQKREEPDTNINKEDNKDTNNNVEDELNKIKKKFKQKKPIYKK